MSDSKYKYMVEIDGTPIRLGLLEAFDARHMPKVMKRILRERPVSVIVIRPMKVIEAKREEMDS